MLRYLVRLSVIGLIGGALGLYFGGLSSVPNWAAGAMMATVAVDFFAVLFGD